MSVLAGAGPRPSAARLARVLDRPDVVLAVVPAGTVLVGIVQRIMSQGFDGTVGLLGFVAVALFYLCQLAAAVADPRWSTSGWSAAFIATSPFSSLAFNHFLVHPMPGVMWTWLLPPVVMVSAYLCTVRDMVLVYAMTMLAGVGFFVEAGYDLDDNVPMLAFVGVLAAATGALTRRVLGNLRQVGEAVQARTSRDPLTGVLNGIGLDDAFARLLGRMGRTERTARHGPDDVISLLVVQVDDLKPISELEGNVAVDHILVRTADALTKAYRRDHLVARLRGDNFVVVTTQPVRQLAAVLAAEVRRVNADRGLTASIGGVERIWAQDMSVDRLGGLILLAEGQLEQVVAEGGANARFTPFDRTQPLPGPANVPLPDLGPRPEDSRDAVSTTDAPLFGAASSLLAFFALVVPTRPGVSDLENGLLVAGAAVVAVLGVLIGFGWVRGTIVQVLTTTLLSGLAAVSVATATHPVAAICALALVPMPLYLTSLTLPMTTSAWLTLLMPVAAWYALFHSEIDPRIARMAVTDMVGFSFVTSGLGLWVRRMRDVTNRQLLRIAATDPVTGLLSREGLIERYRALGMGGEIAVVYLDVDNMERINAAVGTHGGDAVLRRLGSILLELVAPDGAAARIGGDEFVLLLPGPSRSAGLMRKLSDRMAVEDVPVTLSMGQAFGRADGDGTLWRLMAHADEALLLNRARDRHSRPQQMESVDRPGAAGAARSGSTRRSPRAPRPAQEPREHL